MIERIRGYFGGETFQARAYRGTVLTLTSVAGQNALRLISNLILTRLLFPEAFGLMALVFMVTAGVQLFADFGLKGAIVQDKRGADPAYLNTAWTLQILRGLFLFAIVQVIAGPVAAYYAQPQLEDLMRLAAVASILQGAHAVQMMTASRELRLGRVTAITLVSQALGVVAMVLLAWWLRSVWALAWGALVPPLVLLVLSHRALPRFHHRLTLERDAASRLIRYSVYIFISSIAAFFLTHSERAVLGKYIPIDDLGLYNIALIFAVLPFMVSEKISQSVFFPLYARRPPAESEGNRQKLNRARLIFTGGLLLTVAGLGILGDWLIRTLYDPRYHGAGAMMVLFALAIGPQIIQQTYVRLPLASGESERFMVYQVAGGAIRFGGLLLLVPGFGIAGAALARAATPILLYPLLVWLIRPYKAWDPGHDTLYLAVWAAIAALVLWINWDAVAPLLP